jgi:hypothetical protein
MLHFFRMTTIGKVLLAGGAFLFVALIAFRNMGLLPLGTSDFVFFAVLTICIAAYRPGWVFLLLVMALPIETVNLAPLSLGIELRPYQFLEVAIFSGLLIRFLSRRPFLVFPKFGLPDALLLLILIGSLFALANAPSVALSFKLSLVLLSLYGLYVLGRVYLQSLDDVRKVLPFVLASGVIVLFYSFFQNIRFLFGFESFQVMPGRPDGGFPEPDWLGGYLVFLGTVLLVIFSGVFWKGFPKFFRDRLVWYIAVVSLITLFAVLLMTVARSAWLGMIVSGMMALGLFAYARRDKSSVLAYGGMIAGSFLVALLLVVSFPLTRFDLSGRAASTAGWQEITVSCLEENTLSMGIDRRIMRTKELPSFGCRHINLEEIGRETSSGNFVTTVFRPDPNVEIRKDIYGISWEKMQEHPVLGIGWGSIGASLGTDENGHALNASNVFLEVWLGSGPLGFLGLVGFLTFVLVRAARSYLEAKPLSNVFPMFVLSAIPGLIIFNLFNSGILLGFLWILFAALLISEDR